MTPIPIGRSRIKTQVAPVDHALRAAELQRDRALRLADAALAAAQLSASPEAAAAWEELWAIGDAAWRRYERLQQGFVASWFSWLHYASTIHGASTLSKLSEREVNIVNQAAQLVSNQSVSLLTLWENVEVDVLHWLTARGGEGPQPMPAGLPAPAPARTAVAAE